MSRKKTIRMMAIAEAAPGYFAEAKVQTNVRTRLSRNTKFNIYVNAKGIKAGINIKFG